MQQLYQKFFKMQVGTGCFYREYVFTNSFQIRCAIIIVIIFSFTLVLFGNNKAMYYNYENDGSKSHTTNS